MKAIKIRQVQSVKSSDVRRLILSSDPWLKLGYSEKDIKSFVNLSKKHHTLAAFKGSEMIGFAIVMFGVLGGGYLINLSVSTEWRGQGIGEKLMQKTESEVFARSKNYYLCVSSFNKQAQSFYRRLGFKKVGNLKKLLVANHDEFLYRKTIGPLRSASVKRKRS